MSSIFLQASMYTLDTKLKSILESCSKGKYPPDFRINRNKIVTSKGRKYDICHDPMDLCNLIHDIIYKTESQCKFIPASSSRSSTKRTTRLLPEISDDAIYHFAKRERIRLNKDEYYEELLSSCIFTAILIESIKYTDFQTENGIIKHINNIDTNIPKIISLNI